MLSKHTKLLAGSAFVQPALEGHLIGRYERLCLHVHARHYSRLPPTGIALLQISCQSDSTKEKVDTSRQVTRPLQSTEEERQQRPGKHQILNVAEKDLEGNADSAHPAACLLALSHRRQSCLSLQA